MNYPYPDGYNIYQDDTHPEDREDLPFFAEYLVNANGNGTERLLCLHHAIEAIYAAVHRVNGWTRDEIRSQLVIVKDEGGIEGVNCSYDPTFSEVCEECGQEAVW